MIDFIKFFILFVIAVVSLSSCSIFGGEKTAEVVPPPKPEDKKVEAPPAPKIKMEPGSIWSETSRWNELFTESNSRNIGDVVFIKPSDQFKALLSGKPDRITQSASDYVNAAARESNQIVVRIKEILPQGVYIVEGDQTLKVRGRVQKISVAGKIRERDIATDDTAPSEAIFDMNLEVNGQDPDATTERTVASNDDNSDPNKTKDKKPEGDKGTKAPSASK
jgi:flagellar basal body L-ring protein FlgH